MQPKFRPEIMIFNLLDGVNLRKIDFVSARDWLVKNQEISDNKWMRDYRLIEGGLAGV